MDSSDQTFCSRRARDSSASINGTATEASHWLLVEVPVPWGGRAVEESKLPHEVKNCLLDWEADADDRRVQFIRREVNQVDYPGRITVFTATVNSPREIYRFQIAEYTELPARIPEGMSESAFPSSSRIEGPIFLTCTNGRRDACCARWGREMATAVSRVAGLQAWQTTHLGGHRFAPTQLVLPHGSQYGWLEPEDAGPLTEAHRRGRLYDLDHYRGHVGYPRAAQAAEIHLRRERSLTAVDALSLLNTGRNGEKWHVRFQSNNETHEVTVIGREGDMILPSCGGEMRKAVEFLVDLGDEA